MENIKLACSEVYCILELLGDTYKNKLPKKFLEFINQNRNIDFSLEIDNSDYENLKISKDALVLVSYLNLKYWVEDEDEKQRLLEIYKKNDEKKKELLNAYKDPNWLSKSNQEENNITTSKDELDSKIINKDIQNNFVEENTKEQGKDLIEIKKETIFDKIKKVIKKIFNKKKE